MKKILVWDLPTRLFHWMLVVAVTVSIYTGLTGGFVEMDVHMISGYFILGLILFRFAWGFLGHYPSRFSSFIKGPSTTWDYTRKLVGNEAVEVAGHNPLGAISIVIMLMLFLAQASTGLFANDDIMTEGPLTHLVSYDLSRTLTAYHKFNFRLIVGIISLHLLAVLFYTQIKKQTLINPMITGNKWVAENHPTPVYRCRWITATSLIILIAALIYSALRFL